MPKKQNKGATFGSEAVSERAPRSAPLPRRPALGDALLPRTLGGEVTYTPTRTVGGGRALQQLAGTGSALRVKREARPGSPGAQSSAGPGHAPSRRDGAGAPLRAGRRARLRVGAWLWTRRPILSPDPEAPTRSRFPRGSLRASAARPGPAALAGVSRARRPGCGQQLRSLPAGNSRPSCSRGARRAGWGHGALSRGARRRAGVERDRDAQSRALGGCPALGPGTLRRSRGGRPEGGGRDGAGGAGGRRAPSASRGRLGLAGDAGGDVVQRLGVRHPERLRGALRGHAEDLRVRERPPDGLQDG